MKRYILLSVVALFSLMILSSAKADESTTAVQTLRGNVPALHQAVLEAARTRGLEVVTDNVGAASGEVVVQDAETRIAIRLYRRRAGVVTVAVTANSLEQSRAFLDLVIASRK